MNKDELRKLYKSKRKEFSQEQIDELSEFILQQLKNMPIWDNQVFHVFVPISRLKEVNTFPIMNYLFQNRKRIVVPIVENNQMTNAEITESVEWEVGEFNVNVPKEYKVVNDEEINVVLIPMLIADQLGNRVGYGAGFYDRFLARLNPNTIKIGLNYFEPIEFIADKNPLDISLDYCVTPKSIVSFFKAG